MTLEQAQARYNEIEMIQNTCCNCELSFGAQVYIEQRKKNLLALIEEKLNTNYKDGIRTDRTGH